MADNIINNRVVSGKLLKSKVAKLSKLAKQQQAILLDNLEDELGALTRIGNRSGLTENIIGQLIQYTMFDMFQGDIYQARIDQFMSNIETAAKQGRVGIGAGMSMDKIAPEMFKVYSEQIQNQAMSYVTNMEQDLQRSLTNIFDKGLAENKSVNEISKDIQKEFGFSEARANTIARTETMRTNNQISYDQARENGAKYFVIDNREEACEECQAEYEGQVFGIDEDDAMPPLHPNCACVPTFFDNEEEAQNWIDGIQEDNMERREELELQNMIVSPDGTGAVHIDPERLEALSLMENTGKMTIPRSELYQAKKTMYKQTRMGIMNARHTLQNAEKPQVIKNIKKGTAKPFNTNKTYIPKGERKVYDLHLHSSASPDSTEKIGNIVKEAKRIGLDGIAITNHNNLSEALKAAEKYSTKNFRVIPGVEITTSKGHVIALGITKDIRSGMSPERTIRLIKQQGGIAILPHSFARYRDGVLYKVGNYRYKIGKMADGLETVNARYSFGKSNAAARQYAEKNNLPQIAGSDSHNANTIGVALTEIRSKNNTLEEVLGSIKNGHTNVYDSQVPLSKVIRKAVEGKESLLASYVSDDYTLTTWIQSCIMRLSDEEVPKKEHYKMPVLDPKGVYNNELALQYLDELDSPNDYTAEQIYNALYRLDNIQTLIRGDMNALS